MKSKSVPVETVMVGDTVTLTWKDGDITRIAHGVIQNIERRGHTRVLVSECGGEIGRFSMAHPRRVQCVLDRAYIPRHTELEGFDDI